MALGVDRDSLDHGQYPDAWEYEAINPDVEIRVRTKEGFTLGSSEIHFGDDWRVRPSGGTLYVEWNNAGTWEEQGRFETA